MGNNLKKEDDEERLDVEYEWEPRKPPMTSKLGERISRIFCEDMATTFLSVKDNKRLRDKILAAVSSEIKEIKRRIKNG